MNIEKFIYDIESLYSILSSMNEAIFITNTKNNETIISKNIVDEFNFKKNIIKDSHKILKNMIHKDDIDILKKGVERLYKKELDCFIHDFRIKNHYEQYVWIRGKITLFYDKKNKIQYLIGSIENLEKLGLVDNVTKIYFYDKFKDKIEAYIKDIYKSVGVIVFDLDNFNHINSLNNYEFGDKVLRKTIVDIKNILPENSKIYRLYGDKFIIICLDSDERQIKDIYLQIQKYTLKVYEIDNTLYQISICAGISIIHEKNKSINEAINEANIARKIAKEKGKNRCEVYDEEILKKKLKEQELINEFRESIRTGFNGFSLVFQPICNTDTLKINGAEVLLRYNSKSYGNITPIEFIPILEKSGLIIQIGEWIIDQALLTCKKCIKYIPDFHVNINVSLKQSINHTFANHIINKLNEYELGSENIVLELTETCFIENKKEFLEGLQYLRINGIKIAMDDFGTGYSSLGRLQEIPVDIVKIDRSFVKTMKNKNYDYNFIKSIIGLCHNASLKVCIEGIETKEELGIVNNFYADTFQGYYISKPISENDFLDKYIKTKNPCNNLKIIKNHFSEKIKVIDTKLLLLMMDSTPLCMNLWNENFENIACNQEAVKLFDLRDKNEYLERFFELSPKYQPCGKISSELAFNKIKEAFEKGENTFKWMHCKLNGELIPCEIKLIRMLYKNRYIVAGYTRDLRHQILAEKAMTEDNELLNEIMDATPLCLNLWNDKYENKQCNKAAVSLFNLNNKTDYLEKFFQLSPEYQLDGEKSSEKAKRMIDIAFEEGENIFEWMHCDLDGNLIPSEVTLRKIKIKNDDMVVGYTRDMRIQIDRENKIKLINNRSRSILNNMPLGYIQYDLDGNVTDLNPEISNIFGVKENSHNIEIKKYLPEYQPSGEKSSDKLNKKFNYTIKEGFCSFEFILKNYKNKLIHTNMTMIYLNTEKSIICFIQDLSEIKNITLMNDKLKKLAYFDGLTGVYNRNAFFEQLDKRFENIDKKEGYSLILLDFDHFKFINDTYGHIIGDQVLQETIALIKNILPKDSIFGRYGGDEFLIQPGLVLEEDLHKILKDVIKDISQLKIKCYDELINISVSMGVAFYKNEIDYNTWINNADSALYEVKENGRSNYKIYV